MWAAAPLVNVTRPQASAPEGKLMKRLLFVLLVLVAAFAIGPALGLEPAAAAQQPTIADLVVASAGDGSGEFSILLAAVQAADPAVLEVLADPNLRITVFAPTNAAFTNLLAELNLSAEQLLANRTLVTNILLYHVYSGVFDSTTLANETRRFPRQGAAVLRSIGLLLDEQGQTYPTLPVVIRVREGQVRVNRSNVIQADLFAANGVVHVIDRVLLPPNSLAVHGA
jgi:uncharacterized surface protein with fasciclin (FAS1) repeats